MSLAAATGILSALAALQGEPVYLRIPLEELELEEGAVLPRYDYSPPWGSWDVDVLQLPWAALESGEALYSRGAGEQDEMSFEESQSLGELVIRSEPAAEFVGRLYVPKANGGGFLRLGFRVPPGRGPATERDFQEAELRRAEELLRARVPGGAWFRHRRDVLAAALGRAETEPSLGGMEEWRTMPVFRDEADALGLFTGGRALYENLQLERGLPVSPEAEESVDLASLPGITVKAIDWKPLLQEGEVELDPLATLIPADQHALFFPSFEAFVSTLDEADRLGSLGLSTFEERSTDAGTREHIEHQLALEMSELARTLGPLVVESVALTGSDAYLRSGSDVALLLRAKAPDVVEAYVEARQVATGAPRSSGELHGVSWRGAANPERSVSSYAARIGETMVVTNSLVQLEQLARVSAGAEPSLGALDEYRYFRQRYARGEEGETALLVLSDATIRRWCSPRWRIASARIARAAAELAEEHAAHFAELLKGVGAPQELGVDADFPSLGALHLTRHGIHSLTYGTLDFTTPIAELPLERVTPREAELYNTWREGYERAWSNFFDPIAARLMLAPGWTGVDLTVRPLIGDTDYADMRRMTGAAGLPAGAGDAHAETILHFVLAIDPEWETLRSLGATLGAAGEKLGADPLSWMGGWVALYADDGPFWDELLQLEDMEEIPELFERVNEIPLALAVGVRNPLKLALFMTSLRAFVDGTAPGMSVWKERVVGERRFVEISSPGLGEEFSLFYATTPTALFLALHEPTLLAAMEREERARAAETPAKTFWDGAQAALELRGRGVEVLSHLITREAAAEIARSSWRNLPILDEWKRLHPERDPVELHERIFHERLVCPGGGEYVWNPEWDTMESSFYGHPGSPRSLTAVAPAWDGFTAARFALTFEGDGLRARAELERE